MTDCLQSAVLARVSLWQVARWYEALRRLSYPGLKRLHDTYRPKKKQ